VITIHETQLVNKAVGGVLFADYIPKRESYGPQGAGY
jgi:hypothetical protein